MRRERRAAAGAVRDDLVPLIEQALLLDLREVRFLHAARLLAEASVGAARRLFAFSILYLFLVFAALIADGGFANFVNADVSGMGSITARNGGLLGFSSSASAATSSDSCASAR